MYDKITNYTSKYILFNSCKLMKPLKTCKPNSLPCKKWFAYQFESEDSASLDSESSDSNESFFILDMYIIISHIIIPSSLSFSSLSSAVRSAGRYVGRACHIWLTGRQRPPTSSQPCGVRGGASETGGAMTLSRDLDLSSICRLHKMQQRIDLVEILC